MVYSILGNCQNWSTRKLGTSTLIYYISKITIFAKKTYIMVSCTCTFVHGTPHYVTKQPEYRLIFVYFLKKFVHVYNIFGLHQNSVGWKWKGIPLNTILFRLTGEGWPETPKKPPKITGFGWFSSFFGILRPEKTTFWVTYWPLLGKIELLSP